MFGRKEQKKTGKMEGKGWKKWIKIAKNAPKLMGYVGFLPIGALFCQKMIEMMVREMKAHLLREKSGKMHKKSGKKAEKSGPENRKKGVKIMVSANCCVFLWENAGWDS